MKRVREVSAIDRISALPDSIRSHILSFLPTKDAVATTFLSTKWKYLWTIIPNINFTDCDFSHKYEFSIFINRVMIFYNAQSINKFSLKFFIEDEDNTSYDYHAWVTWAILKNARIVDLNLRATITRFFPLPVNLFSCQMLEVLKLQGTIIQLLTTICLPKLTTLELIDVQYQNDESASNLISSCASLKSLYIKRMEMDGINTFTISSSTLEVLSISMYSDYWERVVLKYVINVLPLQYLHILDGSVSGFLIVNSPSLVKVNANDTCTYWEYDYVAFNSEVARFLKGICSVRTLHLMEETFQASIPSNLFPKFDRLTHLNANAKCCKWSLLQDFIKNAGRLNHLSFTKKGTCSIHNEEGDIICWRNPESVPECLMTNLRKMVFVGFEGFEDELAMVEYILQNGQVMKSMEIKIKSSLDDKRKVELLQKLLKFRRLSKRCQVIIF